MMHASSAALGMTTVMLALVEVCLAGSAVDNCLSLIGWADGRQVVAGSQWAAGGQEQLPEEWQCLAGPESVGPESVGPDLAGTWLCQNPPATDQLSGGPRLNQEQKLAGPEEDGPPGRARRALPAGRAVIRGPSGGSEIVVTTTPRLAGAIHSLTWNGKEFINSFDHGRQLQSAANFDLGTRFTGETFNPTEAGSRQDGAGPLSTSQLLHLVAAGNSLQTTSRMAFWLAPGEKSAGNPAKNQTLLSDHLLTKRVQIGYRDLPHVIQYDVTFGMPVSEHHRYAQFEAVTGYMPAEFRKFWRYDPPTRELVPISDGPGEQADPVVLSTADGQFAMGVFSPDQPSPGYEHAGYGRFRFEAQKVVKWNCVFRYRDSVRVPPGDYSFRTFVIVGTQQTVTEALRSLHQEFDTR